jgi:hypothetical protein
MGSPHRLTREFLTPPVAQLFILHLEGCLHPLGPFRGAHSLKSGTERSGKSTKSHAPAARVQSLAKPQPAEIANRSKYSNWRERRASHALAASPGPAALD